MAGCAWLVSRGFFPEGAAALIFYKHFIGDFQRDTSHLSLTERGAYRSLLDHHYATEKPLPKDVDALCRIVGAVSKADRAAVAAVIPQFWTETAGGWINARAQVEMGKAQHQRTVNREIGKRGGRPKGTKSITESVSESVSESKANRNPSQTPDINPKSQPPPSAAQGADPKKALFDLGVSVLGERRRSLIGKAVATVGLPKVGEVLAYMAGHTVADPVSYFTKATQPEERKLVV